MLMFLSGLAMLLLGYLFYGRLVEKILGPDDRVPPAIASADGVDYVVMPCWRNMMIQLLNIAGVGPVIGVILGIKFGAIVFLIIPVGNIIGGAVHDFVSGMMSLRHNGANLPLLIRMCQGRVFYFIFSVFMIVLLLLVVAVFITTPAQLLDGFWPDFELFWYAVAVIFVYYILATLFPVDKIIGMCYPIFGALLILGTLFLFIRLMIVTGDNPALLTETPGFRANMFTPEKNQPIIPLLFVTIACGILSGFHATQSPIIARTMRSEHEARRDFYGMMVLEGFIAMVWAAAGLVIYNLFPDKMNIKAPQVLLDLCEYFLGRGLGGVVVVSVIILSITSGDTAMRSLRLSLAEIFQIAQAKLANRIWLCLPLIVAVAGLLWWSNQSAETFNQLWNYFAWGNQVLGACTLTAATTWLTAQKKNAVITILPGVFMTFIVICYILWISPEHGGPIGFGLNLGTAQIIAAVAAAAITAYAVRRGIGMRGQRW